MPIKRRWFAYVDESGQETAGLLFVVSVLMVSTDRQELQKQLEHIEKKTKKRHYKWRIAHYRYRRAYMTEVSRLNRLTFRIYYQIYTNHNADYRALTAQATANALRRHRGKSATVYVDGLRKTESADFKRHLKSSTKMSVKVRGVRKEENNSFIRLADAICGLIRDALQEEQWSKKAIRQITRRDVVRKLP